MDSVASPYSQSTSFLPRPFFYASENAQEAPFERTTSSCLREPDELPEGSGSEVPKPLKDLKVGHLLTVSECIDGDFKLGNEFGKSKVHDFNGARDRSNGLLIASTDRRDLEMENREDMGDHTLEPSGSDSYPERCLGTNGRSKPQAAALRCQGSASNERIFYCEECAKEHTDSQCSSRLTGLPNRESTETLDIDSNQWYSPEESGSSASTASPVSTSASLSALPSPAFTQCNTAPAVASNLLDADKGSQASSRCQTQAHQHSESFHQIPSPAEKLSERKRKKFIENIVTIQNDGTVEVDVDRNTEIAPTLFDLEVSDQMAAQIESEHTNPIKAIPPHLNIAMLIVGTRGDVQPFLAIGQRLQERGHRVRLATHTNFREFVVSNGLEFYPLGGDPKVLAGYMVKNKGFLPSGPSEISIQKKQLRAIMNSLLPACTESDGESGAPFQAEAIIANPPAYGHVHVAECLGVPLHIFFTMPWTPTNEFPHPLARVKQQAGYWISYLVVDSLMWWGMRGLINEFRTKKLKLSPMTYFSTNQGSIAHLPTGYMWSPHLVPKPKDWGPRVDVVGFCFLSLAPDYKPPDALVRWLQAGEKPIYVGFGSLPVEDPGRMTEIIIEALHATNQRGIIDKGWGGLGNLKEATDCIFLLENCPHDWLFPQCAAVVHHGGAGTTAAGLKAGCPTTIVPFFGDQPFWGERVYVKGVGPPLIPIQQFSFERLVYAINFMLDAEVKQRALELAKQMEEEDGVEGAVNAFYRHWVSKVPHTAPTAEPPSLFQTILVTLQRLSCLTCCT